VKFLFLVAEPVLCYLHVSSVTTFVSLTTEGMRVDHLTVRQELAGLPFCIEVDMFCFVLFSYPYSGSG